MAFSKYSASIFIESLDHSVVVNALETANSKLGLPPKMELWSDIFNENLPQLRNRLVTVGLQCNNVF
jgi:hypothetical protein